MHDRASRELARQWDARDPLARFRKRFSRPAGQIYFDSDSLGLCSQDAERALLRALSDWKTKGSDSISAAVDRRVMDTLAQSLGTTADEVAVAQSSTLVLQQLLATLYRRQFHRPQVVLDRLCACPLRATVQQHLELRGFHGDAQLLIVEPDASRLFDELKFEQAMANPTVQMAILSSVVPDTGQLLDIARLARTARRYGVLIGFDLSHSLGIIPHALDEWQVDFAFWTHDKFANAGPGAASGYYLHPRHFSALHDAMDDSNDHGNEGAPLLQTESPSLLRTASLDGALRVIEEAGLERLRAKSLDLTQFLRVAIEGEIPELPLLTPREPARRGPQLACVHPAAQEIRRALRQKGVSVQFREPDVLCFAPAPLYNSFVECWDAVQILRRVLDEQSEQLLAREQELAS